MSPYSTTLDTGTALAAALAFAAIMCLAAAKPEHRPAEPDEPPAPEAVETDDPCLPRLAELLLPACEYAEALVQEADEGDAPPAEMKLLCDTADGLWRIYHKLNGETTHELGEETADGR